MSKASPKKGTKGGRRSRKLPTPEAPYELAVVADMTHFDGAPDAEGGPAAFLTAPWASNAALTALSVAEAIVSQMAQSPVTRALFNTKRRCEVFLLTDAILTENIKTDIGLRITPHVVPTFTECQRLMAKARWIRVGAWKDKEAIVRLAANELEFAQKEDPTIEKTHALFVVWKKSASSFGGASQLEIAQEICNVVFTYPIAEKAPTYRDSNLDDDDGPEPADWWKDGTK
jgi:hypothetical protein